ncbi:trans-sialidase, putative [Trypanosoma cruzi]|uniref:Trans-sialidase, putative n=1 Tax=Trypanosoma cruzi (strain CL Brener) TaxID=353153 RepID=Q4E443_TRYCC|nr:trans-sialidase, putative [Trypanosoma cruzi]EAN99527.1 trans-sialidase, putative [Trypanosoma cruzi]|eukprot:XP_821378.1 trans-sialidase [Trypanosoma cruzi strain CL Brener]
MLSRVAAVKAPRKHNRRRVTGSSGRRREGGESEPQRPSMSRHLFYSAVLLLVVMMCCNAGGAAEAPGQSSEPNYKWKNIKNEGGVTVESLGVPGLLKVGSDVFAVAEAQCKKSDANIFTGIASQLLTKDNADTPVELLNGAKDKTQVLEKYHSAAVKKVDVCRPTTVMQGNDIYMLVGKYSQTAATGQEGGGADDWGLLLVQGNVSDEGGGEKRIQWNENQRLVGTFSADEHKRLTQLIGGGGSGIKTNDGTLVFPVEGTKKGEAPKEDKKTVSLIIYSKDAKSWTLSKGMSADGCSDPSVVEWKDKKLMMMTACDDGRRRVYESGDKGELWTEALGTLSRVWSNKKGEEAKAVRSGFITATIDGVDGNRNVMLVTLPVYSEETDTEDNGKSELHLWLTDNTHIFDIGPVSDDDAAASSLLYKSAESETKKEELIVLYEKKKGDEESSHSLWSVLLTEQLQRVKDVLATWKKVDDLVSKLCTTSSAVESTSPENACSPTVKITDGLVGFLSDNFSDNTWRDEYLGVNATVKKKDGATKDAGETGATKTSDGVTFQGAWAEWPVGKQGENQLYHFANYNFTLVATVSIDGVPEEGDTHIPLMGVKMDDSGKSVLLGLSYNSGGKWELSCGEETPKELSSTWEKDTTHQVVILLRNGTQGSAYVDGQRVGNGQFELKTAEANRISHFYIGGDERSAGGAGRQEELSVTVRNVLLYNRPLSIAEIGALNPNKALIPPVVSDNAQGTLSQFSPAGQPPSGPKLLNENEGTGGGSTSTSTPSTVTTSLGKEKSAIQLPLGVSSGGNKNVDVASPSDGDPTVGAEAGGAVQGDTPPQTPVDTPDKADPNAPAATDVAQVDPADTTEVGARSGENGEKVGGADGQKREDIHAQDGEVKAAALSSSLGNASQGNNSDAGTVRGSGLLPSLLLLLGLWVFAAP